MPPRRKRSEREADLRLAPRRRQKGSRLRARRVRLKPRGAARERRVPRRREPHALAEERRQDLLRPAVRNRHVAEPRLGKARVLTRRENDLSVLQSRLQAIRRPDCRVRREPAHLQLRVATRRIEGVEERLRAALRAGRDGRRDLDAPGGDAPLHRHFRLLARRRPEREAVRARPETPGVDARVERDLRRRREVRDLADRRLHAHEIRLARPHHVVRRARERTERLAAVRRDLEGGARSVPLRRRVVGPRDRIAASRDAVAEGVRRDV